MITTNDDSVATICRAFKEHGMAQNGAKARYILEGVEDELRGQLPPMHCITHISITII